MIKKIPEQDEIEKASMRKKFRSMYNDYYGFGDQSITSFVRYIEFIAEKLCGRNVHFNLYHAVYNYHDNTKDYFENLYNLVMNRIIPTLQEAIKTKYNFGNNTMSFSREYITEYTKYILQHGASIFKADYFAFEKSPLVINYSKQNVGLLSINDELDGNNYKTLVDYYLS